jgi:hypothetical protein
MRHLLALSLFGLTLGAPLPKQSAPESDLAQLRAAISRAYDRVAVFDVTYEVLWKSMARAISKNGNTKITAIEKDPVDEHRMLWRHVLHGSQGRIEILDAATEAPVQITVYDLRQNSQKTLYVTQRQGMIGLADLVVLSNGADYRVPWLHAFGILPVHRALEQRADTRCVPVGKGRYVLECPPTTATGVDLSSFGFKLVVDAGKNGACESIEVTERVKKGEAPRIRAHFDVTEWKELAGGAWAPLRTRTREYLTSDEFVGQVINVFEISVDQRRSKWGAAPAPELLTLDFPEGTNVHDQIRRVLYTQGTPNAEKRLDNLAQQAVTAPPVQSETLIAAAPWWQSTPAIIAYVVLALALVYIIIRRRRLAAG